MLQWILAAKTAGPEDLADLDAPPPSECDGCSLPSDPVHMVAFAGVRRFVCDRCLTGFVLWLGEELLKDAKGGQ